jgi:hypothetical protein
MSVTSDVIDRIRAILPDSEDRFSDDLLGKYVSWALAVVSAKTSVLVGAEDVTLIPGVSYYVLPPSLIKVKEVLYAKDGTTFTDGVLFPVTFDELDALSCNWPQESGEPENFIIFGCPGTTKCYLMIYRKNQSADEKLRVRGPVIATDVDKRHTDRVVLPYVMALIYAQDEFRLWKFWYSRYLQGVKSMTAECGNRSSDTLGGPHGVPMSGGPR